MSGARAPKREREADLEILSDAKRALLTNPQDRLDRAALDGNLEHVKFLFSRGNSVRLDLERAMCLACHSGRDDIVDFLLSCRVFVGDTEALSNAAWFNHVRIADHLIAHGANVNAKDGQALRSAIKGDTRKWSSC